MSNELNLNDKTLVTFLLDRSGSMEQIKDDTIGAFNAYIATLNDKTLPGDPNDIIFTLVTFDSVGMDKVCVRVPAPKAPKLDDKNFVPRHSTPLIDACYKTIKAVEKSLNGETPKIVICFQTDGFENASHQHSWDQLNALIKEKTALGWQFNFLGANIDNYATGTRMGLTADQTMSHGAGIADTMSGYTATASNTRLYASGQSVNTSFSAGQKVNSGDRFSGKAQPSVPTSAPFLAGPTPDLNLSTKDGDELDLTK